MALTGATATATSPWQVLAVVVLGMWMHYTTKGSHCVLRTGSLCRLLHYCTASGAADVAYAYTACTARTRAPTTSRSVPSPRRALLGGIVLFAAIPSSSLESCFPSLGTTTRSLEENQTKELDD